ncbi:MAG: JAB domain-containing protein [Pseudomonadota bacterium]
MTIHPHRLHDTIDYSSETRLSLMVEYLRSVVLQAPEYGERFHAIFVDSHGRYLADAAMGQGEISSLKLRMRDLFGKALSAGANAIIIAHNHPSGDCRPSEHDIEATLRLAEVGEALDIELLDHLIFTHSTVYSMRAGGIL